MSEIPEDMLKAACEAFSEACAIYPDGEAKTHISDWFDLDAQDAVDFGVLSEPKWHGHSDIRGMQHEQYIAAVIKEPMRAALRTALSEAEAALDEREIASGLTSNGNLWRFWAEKAKDMAVKLSAAEQRVQEARRIALEEAAAYHEYRANNHAAAHKHVVSDFHEMMETTHRDAADDIRALIPSEPQPEKDKSQDDAEGRA